MKLLAAMRKNGILEKIILVLLIALCIVAVILDKHRFSEQKKSGMEKVQSHSDLISTKDIAALSVSEFVYNGIAQLIDDDGEIDYNALYKSTVKVSVDANNISYAVDEQRKVVTFTFPEFTIENPVIDVESISLIPNRKDLVMKDIIALCRSDALEEAKESEKLLSSARENLQSIIEAWYSPVLQGYSFEYTFNTAEGGESE